MVDLGGRRCIRQVEVGKRDRTTVSECRALGDGAGDIDNRNDRGVVGAGNRDRHILGVGAAVGVIDRDGIHHGDRLAGGEEVKLGLGDGVIPVNGAVVGIAGIRADRKGILDCGLLCSRQRQCRGHGLGDFSCRWRIAHVDVGKGNRTGITQCSALGNATCNIDNGDDRGIVHSIDSDRCRGGCGIEQAAVIFSCKLEAGDPVPVEIRHEIECQRFGRGSVIAAGRGSVLITWHQCRACHWQADW